MKPEIAKAAIQFLSRVQLTGQEVDAFITVRSALLKYAAEGLSLVEGDKKDEIAGAPPKKSGN